MHVVKGQKEGEVEEEENGSLFYAATLESFLFEVAKHYYSIFDADITAAYFSKWTCFRQ